MDLNLPRPNLKKDHPDLPDFYGITIYYRDGGLETFSVASHRYMQNDGGPPRIEFVTYENQWNVILWDSVSRIEFDKRFSIVAEINAQRARANKAKESTEKPLN